MHRVNDFRIDQENFLFVLESRHEANFSMDFHCHDFYEIAMVTGGTGFSERLVNDETIVETISQDTLLFWKGGIPHRAVDKRDDPLRQMIVIFDRKYLCAMKDADEVLEILTRNNPIILNNHLLNQKLKASFRGILYEIRTPQIGKDSIVFSHLSHILIQLARHISSWQEYSDQMKDKRILKAVDYIHQHYYLAISLDEISRICALSKRQFSDLFKRETGKSFNQYIHWYRIRKSLEFLEDKSRTVTDIAFEVGYDDVSYFIRRFKVLKGITPHEMQKQTRKP